MVRRSRLLLWHLSAGRSARTATFPNPQSSNLSERIPAPAHHFVREYFEAQEGALMGHYVISLPHPGQPGTVSTPSPGTFPTNEVSSATPPPL